MVNFIIIMVILVFFMVISVNRWLFRYFGSYSGISVIPVILVSRRTGTRPLPDIRRSKIRYETISGPNIKMAATGVLPFVRGIDFTKNDFEVTRIFRITNK